MGDKRILLDQVRPVRRRQRASGGNAGTPDQARHRLRLGRSGRAGDGGNLRPQQRNEAIGLLMLGAASFLMSLLYYMGSSRLSGLASWTMVQLGMGVYLVPVVLALAGLRRMGSQPGTPLGVRLAGTASALVFGLGLLGLEGGKLGTLMFGLFAIWCGIWPTRILFGFLTMVSLIFALDVLYRDLLLAAANLLRWTIMAATAGLNRVIWVVALGIGAIRTTAAVLALGWGHLRAHFNNDDERSDEAPPDLHLLTMSPQLSGAGGPDGVHTPLPIAFDGTAEPTGVPGASPSPSRDRDASGHARPERVSRRRRDSEPPSPTPPAATTDIVAAPAQTLIRPDSAQVGKSAAGDAPDPRDAWDVRAADDADSDAEILEIVFSPPSGPLMAPGPETPSARDPQRSSSPTPTAADRPPPSSSPSNPTNRLVTSPAMGDSAPVPPGSRGDTPVSPIATGPAPDPARRTRSMAEERQPDTASRSPDRPDGGTDDHLTAAADTGAANPVAACSTPSETGDGHRAGYATAAAEADTAPAADGQAREETAAAAGADDEAPGDEEEWEEVEAPEYIADNPIDRDLKPIVAVPAEKPLDVVSSIETDTARPAERPAYELPSLSLLVEPPVKARTNENDLRGRSEELTRALADFGIKATVLDVIEGPAVSRFELRPGTGVKVSRIVSLADDIALVLAAQAVRVEAPIPGKAALGIEIPNPKPNPVFFYDLVANEAFRDPTRTLNLALGVTISGKPVYADLCEMPHLLIAGATGSGKSVCINTIIASILFQAHPDRVKFVMIDPKMVELSGYNGIPHLISPVVTDPRQAASALLWAVEEMGRRYELLKVCGVRNIASYNQDLARLQTAVDDDLRPMPLIVIVIDELADLMMTAQAEVEGSIMRLAQMARAVGIHLIVATQRPSVDVVTGIIKANLPSRIAFSVASQTDSRTILDMKGAEKLLGKGDMLFVPKGNSKPRRVQGAFISDAELERLAHFVAGQGTPEYVDIAVAGKDDRRDDRADEDDDDDDEPDADGELMTRIENWLATQEKTSVSMLQRKFKIGYNRAARLTDILEEKGLVGPQEGTGKRRVLKKLP